MRWQCSLHAQLLSVFIFFLSFPGITTNQPCTGRPVAFTIHIIRTSLLSCAWQHNYQSRGPVQLITGDCWQRGLEWRECGRDETGSRRRCSETRTVPVFQVYAVSVGQNDTMIRNAHGNTTILFSLACVERRRRGWWWWGAPCRGFWKSLSVACAH